MDGSIVKQPSWGKTLDLNILPETKTKLTSQQCSIEILLAHTLSPLSPQVLFTFCFMLYLGHGFYSSLSRVKMS